MSGTSMSGKDNADSGQRWAALDKKHERLVDASHPLLAELRRERDAELPVAS